MGKGGRLKKTITTNVAIIAGLFLYAVSPFQRCVCLLTADRGIYLQLVKGEKLNTERGGAEQSFESLLMTGSRPERAPRRLAKWSMVAVASLS